ncbi:Rrf2 family transcriptional regulator [Candidatus Gottesmanbacteria bacterium]|nr:Rrf2 family transcriptional regulator [Candidatus Gottesmanbacteria bacterium]
MKISKKEDFGLIFMTILARNYTHKYISLSFAAKQSHLSPLFLKQIASRLKNKGLIESKEGIYGGYRLARPPHKIVIAEIIGAISNRIVIPSCIQGVCRLRKNICSCFSFWGEVNKYIFLHLKKIHLKQFAKL